MWRFPEAGGDGGVRFRWEWRGILPRRISDGLACGIFLQGGVIAKLPRWVWTGAWGLSFVAGMINAVGLLGFEHQAVTHLTGTTSLLGEAASRFDLRTFGRIATVMLAFLGGAALSGFLIQDSPLRLGRRYGVALALESLLLVAAVFLLEHQLHAGVCVASMACGLQNAMATTYSGTTVRTTHLSGMFTDLGIYLGHWIRRMPIDQRRLRLCVTIISGFFLGGVAGAAAFRKLAYHALLIPAGATGGAAGAYFLWWAGRARRG